MIGKNVIIVLTILCLNITNALAKTGLKIPRFASSKTSEVNIRTGPNFRYPIKWVLVKQKEPLEIVAEFEHWRKVIDKQGDEGWVHESTLTGKRYGVVIGEQVVQVLDKPTDKARINCQIEPDVRVAIPSCRVEWCEIKVETCSGWLPKTALWGVYLNEEF